MKKRVNITLEDKVIQRIDQYADEHYTSRSGAITMLIVEATEEPKQKMGYFGLIVQKNGGYCESYDGLRGGKYRHTNCEYGEKSKNC